jgi:predicted proteasome-type protease
MPTHPQGTYQAAPGAKRQGCVVSSFCHGSSVPWQFLSSSATDPSRILGEFMSRYTFTTLLNQKLKEVSGDSNAQILSDDDDFTARVYNKSFTACVGDDPVLYFVSDDGNITIKIDVRSEV